MRRPSSRTSSVYSTLSIRMGGSNRSRSGACHRSIAAPSTSRLPSSVAAPPASHAPRSDVFRQLGSSLRHPHPKRPSKSTVGAPSWESRTWVPRVNPVMEATAEIFRRAVFGVGQGLGTMRLLERDVQIVSPDAGTEGHNAPDIVLRGNGSYLKAAIRMLSRGQSLTLRVRPSSAGRRFQRTPAPHRPDSPRR